MNATLFPTAIAVHVRLRPWKDSDGPFTEDAISLSGSTISVPNPQRVDERFKFSLDACYGPDCGQESIFASVRPIVEQVYKGINTTVFAYGVTGSGKTWTMQGSPEDPGVIPRVMKSVFSKKAELEQTSIKVSFSYCEVLMEEIYDLLGPKTSLAKKLDVRTNAAGENVIPDLTIRKISAISEFESLYRSASQSRKTAATKMNSTSSRSHAILTIYVETAQSDVEQTFVGKICLVDLAGSEDNNLTGNDPTRMRESSAINRSLTTLGSVVEALNSKASRIPYRDSKLTRILQDALGGSSLGMVICNLAPGHKFAKEALRTLKFATRTREIENRPMTNSRAEAVRQQPAFPRPGMVGNKPTAGPSRPALATSNAANRTTNATASSSDLGQAVRAEMEKSALALTETQLEDRIQNIVKQMMLDQAPTSEEMSVAKKKEDQQRTQDLSQYTEAERKARAKVLIDLARGHHDIGELELSLDYYRKAKVYVPENQKLARRIVEIELASEGQVPIPKRSGHPKAGDTASDNAQSMAETKKIIYSHSSGNANKAAFEDTSAGVKDKHPTLKRSKALSRPLADITKMVNLAPLTSEAESSNQGKPIKARSTGKTKQLLIEDSRQYSTSAPTQKLRVYNDLVPLPSNHELTSDQPHDGKPKRMAARTAGHRNHQLAFDDSGMTEGDVLDSADEYSPQETMMARSAKRQRI